uniref:SAM-dependent MTase RsmB/NOP-type domain-containing protein n=1 Tax=Octactis speculum TaxID=3111310 RepID=A0A7S2B989_9STRA
MALRNLPTVQRTLLAKAADAVKPKGGRLVYATCSVFAEENEDVVTWFETLPGHSDKWEPWPFTDDGAVCSTKRTGEFSLDGGAAGAVPVTGGDAANHLLPGHWRKILPHVHGADGFFIGRWKRR